ncbi:NAD-dependent epimerase/dehydratase family protein [Shinella zoogloeoides]|uniref:NAD-dependent epimerase/dehydratase family protein n=1 Tax=Shinella zoogloeoides TaxID=352475 RepID=UPI00273F337A|nr:NAD(P)-dependent oxidoreductase [Shinella zoogloeoides]WLR94982.1 NAD(P)-dependent oxidoreductase [Shinella zoogloeoides]
MGGLKVCITGAAGFLGQAAVSEARRRGHGVCAVVRHISQVPLAWAADPAIRVVEADLSKPGRSVQQAVAEADSLLHLAARMRGDDAQMRAGTLAPTRALLALQPRRFVLASSLSVYDATALPPHDALDETCRTERRPNLRDAYCRAKLAQETLVLQSGTNAWILRIGILYGQGRLWNAHLGLRLGRLVIGPAGGQLPLCHVRTAAAALVRGAEQAPRGIEIVNVLDDQLPERGVYIAALRARGDVSRHLPVGWSVPYFLAGLVRDRGPGLLRRPVVAARLKPLTYPNRRMQARLGPLSTADWHAAMEEPA